MKKQSSTDLDDVVDDEGDSWLPAGASQPAEAEGSATIVPLTLALQRPATYAWHLFICCSLHINSRSMQWLCWRWTYRSAPTQYRTKQRTNTQWRNRTTTTEQYGWVAEVLEKTHTLKLVVEPLTITYFGENGHSVTTPSNQTAHNIGPRGRTMHSANEFIMTDYLQTARLKLNAQAHTTQILFCWQTWC